MVVDVNSKLILYLSNNLKKLLKSPSLIAQKIELLNIARSFAIVLFPLEVCPIKKLYFFISIFADFIAPKSVTIKCAMLIKKLKLYPSYKRITIGKCSH